MLSQSFECLINPHKKHSCEEHLISTPQIQFNVSTDDSNVSSKSKQANQRKVSDTSAVVGRKWNQDDGGADVAETKWTPSGPGFVTTKLTDKSTAPLKPSEVEISQVDCTCPGCQSHHSARGRNLYYTCLSNGIRNVTTPSTRTWTWNVLKR